MQFLLRLPFGLLSYLATLIVKTKPPPFIMSFGVSPHLIQLHLLFMVAAIEEIVEMPSAGPNLEHPFLFAAVF